MSDQQNRLIHFNDEIIRHDHAMVSLANRSFLFGDGLFETIRTLGTEMPFFSYHYERLLKGMTLLKMNIPVSWTADYFQKEIERLITRNRSFLGNRIRLTVYRDSSSQGYLPLNNQCSFFIESFPLENKNYLINRRGLRIDLFEDIPKPISPLSGIKSNNGLPFILASIYKQENRLDDCLLLNHQGEIVEATSSNLFLVKEKTIYTPPIESGCLPGVTRAIIIEIAKSDQYKIITDQPVFPQDLLDADEVFLTNSIQGIKWIVAYRRKRYFNHTAKQLIKQLNKKAGFPA